MYVYNCKYHSNDSNDSNDYIDHIDYNNYNNYNNEYPVNLACWQCFLALMSFKILAALRPMCSVCVTYAQASSPMTRSWSIHTFRSVQKTYTL